MVRKMAKSPEQEKVLAMSGWINTGVTAIVVLCFIFLAYYCLRKGEFIHKLLMFRGSNEKT
jgi:flagellar biogenesis protein FliO